MSRKKNNLTAGVILSLLILPSVSSMAFAQYLPDQVETGLDTYLKNYEDKVQIVQNLPGEGSGTPIFAADGVLGAVMLTTGVFGGVAGVFFVMGRKGKYAAIGRG